MQAIEGIKRAVEGYVSANDLQNNLSVSINEQKTLIINLSGGLKTKTARVIEYDRYVSVSYDGMDKTILILKDIGPYNIWNMILLNFDWFM
jgi:hypothetical protein